jgi:putative Ca2+/H+ antiporter (TMEM165/GDT1 family)
MTAFLASLGFVVLAEMGDKTQLLAMAFATRYRASTVMWGVFAATVLNHFLAVLAGNYLTDLMPIHCVQIAAAASFILFGLWTIRGDELAGEDKRFHFNPFWTVAVAFFIAETGDKTQLATVALAAKYQSVMPVLAGTTAGMLIADAIGIGIGIVLGKQIPERAVKWVAALIFIGFGFWGLHEYLPEEVLTMPAALSGIAAVALAVCWLGRNDLRRRIGQAQAVKRGKAELEAENPVPGGVPPRAGDRFHRRPGAARRE